MGLLLNKYTVGAGIFGTVMGSNVYDYATSNTGSNPMVSSQNTSIMMSGEISSYRYGLNETGVSLLSGSGAGALAGAVLGGGVGYAAKKLAPSNLLGPLSLLGAVEKVGKRLPNSPAKQILGKAGGDLAALGPRSAFGVLSLGVGIAAGGVIGGALGVSLFDKGIRKFTHNYLDSSGDSDVRGASAQGSIPSAARALGVAGAGMVAYGLHRMAAYGLHRRGANTTEGISFLKGKWARKVSTLGSSRVVSTGIAAATAMSVSSKLGSANTSPQSSRINGMAY